MVFINPTAVTASKGCSGEGDSLKADTKAAPWCVVALGAVLAIFAIFL